MIELGVRIGFAALIAAAMALVPGGNREIAFIACSIFAVVAVGVWLLEKFGKRNAGFSGFIAVADAMFLAAILASVGELERYGFVTLAPMLWATGRFGSDAAAMAPLVAATLMVSSGTMTQTGFTMPVMLHTLGVLVIGLLTNQTRVVVKETQIPVEVTKEIRVENDGDERVRKGFLSLQDRLEDLEKESRADRLAVKLWTAIHQADEPPMHALAKRLADETTVEGLVLYLCEKGRNQMLVASSTGKVPTELKGEKIPFQGDHSEAQIRHRVDKLLLQHRDPEFPAHSASILLKDRNRLVGMVCVFDDDLPTVDSAVRHVHETSHALGSLLRQAVEKEESKRRLREAEILYSIAAVSIGAESQNSLITRVVRETSDTVGLDHVGVFWTEGEVPTMVASEGLSVKFFEDISFAYGPGVAGWKGIGCPDVYVPDTSEDARVDRKQALKSRVGSYAMLPIHVGGEVVGFLSAAANRSGAIDLGKIETLRVVAGELSQALTRLDQGAAKSSGAMAPKEFYEVVRKGGNGAVVYVEVQRREELAKQHGPLALENAVKKVANRLRQRLPSGGGLCKRDQGDFIAYLPGITDEEARSWATNSAASVHGMLITTPDGSQRMNVTIRSKVAPFASQLNQVSTKGAA
ncbi:GAF domain-containing protein [Kamptonema cortianum]|nr:GAF domain-containing protein [Geitlerinema splendidum]MDK3161027.1 GAF domain-containing protein [Kamptonema cortianum]